MRHENEVIPAEKLEKYINNRTYESSGYAQKLCQEVEKYNSDWDDVGRKRDLACRVCFYLKNNNRIAMQALYDYNCSICNSDLKWANSGTPKVCPECAVKHEICRWCMGLDSQL